MRTYDYKIKQKVDFQSSYNGMCIVHFQRLEWDAKPLPDSNCKIVRAKSYQNVTQSSLNRLSRVVNKAIYDEVGRLELWTTSLGWQYRDFGNELNS